MGDQTYSGRVLTPAVKVTDADGLTLSSLDYTLTYSDNIAAGTATVDIEGRHNYTATSTDSTDFTIRPNSGFTIDTVSDCVYTGSAIEPALTIKDANNTLLIAGTDYTAAYTGNVNAGTASASVTGKGNFTGSKSVSFTITNGRYLCSSRRQAAGMFRMM